MKEILTTIFFFFSIVCKGQTINKIFGDITDTIGLGGIIPTLDSGFAVIGTNYSGNYNSGFIAIADRNGDTISTISVSKNTSNLSLSSIIQNSDSNFFISGLINDSSSILCKLSKSGDFLWEKKYTIANKRLVFRNIHFAGSDSIFILTTVDYSTWYILKTDTSGNIIKQVKFNSPPTINDPWFNDFIVEDNSIILSGYEPGSGGGQNCLLLKIDGSNNIKWTYVEALYYDSFGSIAKKANGDYIVISTYWNWGQTSSNLYCIDSLGQRKWTRGYNFGTSFSTYFSDVKSFGNGNSVITGGDNLSSFILTIDSIGHLLRYQKTFDYYPSINIYDSNRILLTGNGNKAILIDLTASSCIFTDTTTSDDTINWFFNEPAHLTVSDGNYTIINSNAQLSKSRGTIVQDACIESSISKVEELQELLIYPNPFSESTNILLPKLTKNIYLTIYDQNGKVVLVIDNIADDRLELSSDDLKSGMYFIIVRDEERIISRGKVIIE